MRFIASGATLRARAATTNAASGVAVTTGTWYRVDVKAVLDNTATCDIQVDGTAGAQASVASTAGTGTGIQIGVGTAATADVYFDDIIVSGVSGDYPIGAGTVVGLYPSGDGTHVFSATGDFVYEAAGAGVVSGATDTWTHLVTPLATTVGATFMNDAAGATTEFLRWNFADLPASADTVNGVASVSTHHAASATANTQALFIRDVSGDVSEIAVLGGFNNATHTFTSGIDLSETTIVVVYKCQSAGTSTGAWTVANVNDLGALWGSTDVNPDAYIDGICLEVDYVPLVTAAYKRPVNPPTLQAVNRSAVI